MKKKNYNQLLKYIILKLSGKNLKILRKVRKMLRINLKRTLFISWQLRLAEARPTGGKGSVSYKVNDEAVCKTAPATPGLLIVGLLI